MSKRASSPGVNARKTLTDNELRMLFDPRNITYWAGIENLRVACALCASAGLRISEVHALRQRDLHLCEDQTIAEIAEALLLDSLPEPFLSIQGRKRGPREIPLPETLAAELRAIATKSTSCNPDDLVFAPVYGSSANRKPIASGFRRALAKMGIDAKRRGLTVHCFRKVDFVASSLPSQRE